MNSTGGWAKENMHTLVEMNSGTGQGTHVPAFLAKLWKLVDDPGTNDLIYWSDSGNSFVIRNQATFARELLPLYYKHNNMASFVRQLNMYGFHKVVSVEQGGLKLEKDEMEFAHPFFLRGHEPSLELIKRKIPAPKHDVESRIRTDNFQKVLMDVRQMRGRQETMDSKLLTMKRENEALWRELASLRQKHANQTTILSKILQFLVGMMSSRSHKLGFKRRMPLMLNDIDEAKDRKIGRQGQNLAGPEIHDVTEIFDTDDTEEQEADQQQASNYLDGSGGNDQDDSQPKVDSPLSAPSKSPYRESILGFCPEDQDSLDYLLSVDPTIVNPSVQVRGSVPTGQNNIESQIPTKAKGRGRSRKSVNATTSQMNSSEQLQGTVQQGIPILFQGSPAMIDSNVTNENPMGQAQPGTTTTYYIQGADGEPVQVFLSIPTVTQDNNSSNIAESATINQQNPAFVSTTVAQPLSGPTTTQTVNDGTSSTDIVPVARNGNLNPPFSVKTSSSVNKKEDLDVHLDEMQVGLDNLRDLLKSEEYKMDTSTLLGLFGDGELGLDLAKLQADQSVAAAVGLSGQTTGGNVSGQELVSYNPSLFELTEDDSHFFDDSSNMLLDDELESMLTTDRDKLKSQTGTPALSPLSFSTTINNGQSGSGHNSGLTTPVGSGSILGLPDGFSQSPVTSSVVTGAGKRKQK